MKKCGYSYNLMPKKTPYHIFSEQKSTPIPTTHSYTDTYGKLPPHPHPRAIFFHEESIYEISEPHHARFIRYDMHQISFWFFQSGITPEREITRTRTRVSWETVALPKKKTKYSSAIFPWGIHIWNFRTPACTVHKIWHASDFVLIFSKWHNSRKGDNSDKN